MKKFNRRLTLSNGSRIYLSKDTYKNDNHGEITFGGKQKSRQLYTYYEYSLTLSTIQFSKNTRENNGTKK